MKFYSTHTSNTFLDVQYILIPKWYELENPSSERFVLIYKTNIRYKWVHTLYYPST